MSQKCRINLELLPYIALYIFINGMIIK
ncbi:hypothetical protein KPSB59_3300046 [Klebsiella quasipneumoniae subsp. quasipneumoniae]|nr:hypothetical protein KPSB59_3300046 [Klebsiella quasipneumoniae subsp. quasipneumoniae]